MNILVFENENQVVYFSGFHDLSINEQSTVLFINFVNPDTNYPAWRAIYLMENKMNGKSFGEVCQLNLRPLTVRLFTDFLALWHRYRSGDSISHTQ